VTSSIEVDDSEAWQRVRAGDSLAYAELFDRHSARVYRRALGMLGNVHDAEDVTAAAFFELWRKHRSVRLVNGSVAPWLLVTVVNLSRNQVRGLARYRAAIAELPRTEHAGDPAVLVEHRLDGIAALAGLDRVDSALLVLTAIEGFTTAEAAMALGLRPGAARMRLSRLRDSFRQELRRLELRPLTEGETP
jgi:RNA polymerase sigma factor (sigma-70 family)